MVFFASKISNIVKLNHYYAKRKLKLRQNQKLKLELNKISYDLVKYTIGRCVSIVYKCIQHNENR